ADFLAVVFESQGHEGVFGASGFVDHARGKKLGENEAAIGRPAKGVASVGKELIAAVEFVALEKAAALAVEVLEPDIVVLKIVFFGLEVAAGGGENAGAGGRRAG